MYVYVYTHTENTKFVTTLTIRRMRKEIWKGPFVPECEIR